MQSDTTQKRPRALFRSLADLNTLRKSDRRADHQRPELFLSWPGLFEPRLGRQSTDPV